MAFRMIILFTSLLFRLQQYGLGQRRVKFSNIPKCIT